MNNNLDKNSFTVNTDSDIDMSIEMDTTNDNNSNDNDNFKIYILNYDINWIFNYLCCLNQFPEFKKNMPIVNNIEYIKWTFHRLDIGNVLSCKIIENNYDDFYCIEVIFDNLYNNITSKNFYNTLMKTFETRIVHDEPKSWIIYI